LLTDGSFPSSNGRRQLLGGVTDTDPPHHALCRWGIDPVDPKQPAIFEQFMVTDGVGVLNNGVELGLRTWNAMKECLQWKQEEIDKVICHQVGSANQSAILKALGIPIEKNYPSFRFLGNMGTVSLPLTAALAEERNFLKPGDQVSFLGIGSGLNCLMMGVEW
ncbi:MAG: 3-oxoacyl-ACP synthase III, partial [Nitrospinae bacterium]|nr:3-oxoacyl-ACP synthase III [Nitrospinota bacterium]